MRPALADVAYTLQHGRKSFEHRLVVIASTLPMLLDKLGLFLDGREDAGVLAGHAQERRGPDEDARPQGAGSSSLRCWRRAATRRGWRSCGSTACCRIAAASRSPSDAAPRCRPIPFADKRHWIGGADDIAPIAAARGAGLHPLIDSNESTFTRQVFKKTFLAARILRA